MLTVADIMTPEVFTIRSSAKLTQAILADATEAGAIFDC